jgi:hypothetical protein
MSVPIAILPSLEASFAGPVWSDWAEPVVAYAGIEDFGPVYERMLRSFRSRATLPADSDRWDYLLD